MARKPRLHLDGGIYHVMLRGNSGQDIYFDDDRYHFYLLLQQGMARYGHRLHDFCLLSMHNGAYCRARMRLPETIGNERLLRHHPPLTPRRTLLLPKRRAGF